MSFLQQPEGFLLNSMGHRDHERRFIRDLVLKSRSRWSTRPIGLNPVGCERNRIRGTEQRFKSLAY